MLGKTLLAEKLFCAAVDKFTVGADLVMCEFFAATAYSVPSEFYDLWHGILLMQMARAL